jgi:ABC-type sugar transport system permease subunit/ABC-type glycerol-3-phosphate transport system substrate-binding protein
MFAKSLRFILLVVVLAIVVWAFLTAGTRAIGIASRGHDRPVELTILHWGNRAEEGVVQSLVEQFERENPTIKVRRIHASDFDSKLKTMFVGNSPPDLFYLPPHLMPGLVELKLIEPINAFTQADRAAGNGAYLDDYYPLLLDAFTYDAATAQTGSGQLYGLPKDFTTAVFYINVDLFEAAGIDWRRIQTEGWTWDEWADAAKKMTALRDKPAFNGRTMFGGFLQLWPDSLRNVVWTFGGDYFATNAAGRADFRNVTLDEPAAQQALEFIRRVRNDDNTVYNPTGIAKEGGAEFKLGNIGMIGPVGRWLVPEFMNLRNFRWDVVPVPGVTKDKSASQIYLTAWTMSSSTRHKPEAWKLMKFLSGPEGARAQARMGLAVPPLKRVAESSDFLAPPGMPPHRADLFLKALATARVQQNPPQPEWTRIVGSRINESIANNKETVRAGAERVEREWMAELDSPLRRQQWNPLRWDLIGLSALALLALGITLLWLKARREKLGPLDRAVERSGYLFIAPWIIGFAIFTLGPMLLSLVLSFAQWSGMAPLDRAKFVGSANYAQLLTVDPAFWKSLKVTLYFVFVSVPLTQIAALGVAMLMNNRVRGIAVFRTIYFVPSVVAGAVLAVMWMQILNNDYGILNKVLRPICDTINIVLPQAWHLAPPDWFGRDAGVWGVPGFVLMGLWGVGGGMIIYLAGLKGIPASLYEAATIDGAGPWRRFWNVTLPMLSPLIFFNLVMGIIGSFQVFTQAYLIGSGPNDETLFYVLQLFRQAFEFHNMGYASAMAWLLFLVCLGLTIAVFRGSRGLVYYEGLK